MSIEKMVLYLLKRRSRFVLQVDWTQNISYVLSFSWMNLKWVLDVDLMYSIVFGQTNNQFEN